MPDENTDVYFEYFNKFNGVEEALELYREKCRKFAAKYDLPIINLNISMRSGVTLDIFTLQDGVHLTAEGNQLLVKLVLDVIKRSCSVNQVKI